MYLERGSAARREGLINARDTVWRDRNVKYYFSRGARMSGDGIGKRREKLFGLKLWVEIALTLVISITKRIFLIL